MNVQDTNTYVSQVRTQASNLVVTLHKMRSLRDKMDALDLGNTLTQGDIGGDNDGILIVDLVAVLGTTLEAFEGLMSSGHASNLHKIAIV